MNKKTKLLIGVAAISVLLINMPIILGKKDLKFISLIFDAIKSNEIFQLFAPWIIFLILIVFFIKLLKSAQKRKTAALVFGVCVHTFLPPDPKAGMTIEVKKQEERQTKKQEEKNGEK